MATSSTLRRNARSTVESLVMVGGPWESREAGEGRLVNGRDWRVKLWTLFQVSSLVHSLGLSFLPGK